MAAGQDKEDWAEEAQGAQTRLLTQDLDWPRAMSAASAEPEAAPQASQGRPEAAEAGAMSQIRPRHHFLDQEWPETASPGQGCQGRGYWV